MLFSPVLCAVLCCVVSTTVMIMIVTANLLAVTCPKPGKSHQQGLEHAEVVIGSPANGIYHSKPLLEAFIQQHPSELTFSQQ